jgi:GNAT superfamily N-acetyltransferase
MLIREARATDTRAIAEALQEMPELRAILSGGAPETAARVERALEIGAGSAGTTILVAEAEDGSIAGYCAVHWIPFLFLPGPEAYISELFIRPRHRGAGLGTALLKEVEARARRRGCSRLSLLNRRDRESFQRGFYSKRGWGVREEMANFIYPIQTVPNQ